MNKPNNIEMSIRKFNVGDRVTLTESFDIDILGETTTIPIGEVGVIEDVDGDELLVDIPSHFCALTLSVSQVAPYNRRKDFLSRLQSLLREFDAEIDIDSDDYGEKNLYFNVGDEEIQLYYASSISKNIEFPITASSIMDYIKE